MNNYALFVAGEWIGADKRQAFAVINPADSSVIAQLPHATHVDVDSAMASARSGFELWRTTSPAERAKIIIQAARLLRERQEAIAAQMVAEQGKILSEARIEVIVSADILDWSAAEGMRQYGRQIPSRDPRFIQTVKKEPVGVSVLIPSWNVPVLFVARKLSECLAAGCSAILVGHKQTPGASVSVVRALQDAGLPDGVVNLLFGSNAELVEQLLNAKGVGKVSFTGGTETGKKIAHLAAENILKSTLELGGHAPAIVFDDVNVDEIAAILVASKFRNAGQVCNSPTRFYIHRSIYDEFVERFVARTKLLKVGNGMDQASQMGPMAAPRQLVRVDELVSDAIEKGARLLTGGKRAGNVGNFYEPTVIDQITDDARILREEPFGPVASMIPFEDTRQMITQANRLPYGLAAYAYTNSMSLANLVSRELRVGMLGINTPQISLPETPFGGVKQSGTGSEGGTEGVSAYMTTKYVSQLAQ